LTISIPVLHLIAGPNGAGKSTLYQYLIKPRYPDLVFVNADLHERDALQHISNPLQRSEAARGWADGQRADFLARGESFVSETVFSHHSKLDLLRQAHASGFQVALYVVCINEPRQLLRRVKQRVNEGGHDVPGNKILERYPRTIANLTEAVRLADLSMLFDSVDVDRGGPLLVASVTRTGVTRHVHPLPDWARKMLSAD
jgi:predicted ABC-type ATPase